MKKIAWVKISHRKRYGGAIYTDKVKDIIKKTFDLEEINIKANQNTPRYLKLIEWFFGFIKIKGRADLWIEDSFISVAMTRFGKMQGKTALLIYHIDNSIFPFPAKVVFFLLEKIFYYKAKRADVIVTISEYWRNHFLQKGYKNVVRIYNSFNPEDFLFTEKEIEEFKKKYQLQGKPIVYIGNCQKAKGVVEAYQALKNLDVILVTSGEPSVKIAAKNLNLDYKDYARLLKASLLVVTMSKFKEGWCATAHEAMLCKTPVIGSGLGGMKELLEGGKQIVCTDIKELESHVLRLLKNQQERMSMGENGFEYAKTLTLERFKKEWVILLNNILEEKTSQNINSLT